MTSEKGCKSGLRTLRISHTQRTVSRPSLCQALEMSPSGAPRAESPLHRDGPRRHVAARPGGSSDVAVSRLERPAAQDRGPVSTSRTSGCPGLHRHVTDSIPCGVAWSGLFVGA